MPKFNQYSPRVVVKKSVDDWYLYNGFVLPNSKFSRHEAPDHWHGFSGQVIFSITSGCQVCNKKKLISIITPVHRIGSFFQSYVICESQYLIDEDWSYTILMTEHNTWIYWYCKKICGLSEGRCIVGEAQCF